MFRPVELPLWMLVLILLFAAVTFASHFLFPSVRWYFRRRMERVVARLNERLQRPIEPFKLAARQDMIQRLIYDPQVAEAIAEHAAEEGVPEAVAFERARRYAREIVPSFSASVYFGFAVRVTRWLSRFLYHVHLDDSNEAARAAINGDATVVFLMNHRSNMDYVLVPYLVADRSALSYAVGEWARVWPLSRLIRALGAFFIRRKSHNPLYRRVLARYVQLAIKGGVAQAIFPEGGLSLDGGVAMPKLGLLSYIISGFDPETDRDIVFIPVGLNYDRVLEDRILVAADRTGERKFRASVLRGVFFSLRHLWRRLFGRIGRFGSAGVAFGEPMSLTAFMKDTRRDPLRAIGQRFRARVEAVVPALPVPLVSRALLEADGPVTRAMLVKTLAPYCDASDSTALPNAETVVEAGVRILKGRKLITEDAQGLHIVDQDLPLIRYYARSVAHIA